MVSGFKYRVQVRITQTGPCPARISLLVLQHVLRKVSDARNFGFLHPNCKRLIALLHLLLKFDPGQVLPWFKKRAPILCTCCGAVMVILRTRIPSTFRRAVPVPVLAQGAQTV